MSESTGVRLPETVRARVVALAAECLATVPLSDVPPGLRQFARFTPAKRQRLGATAIASALEEDGAFRAAVADALRTRSPELTAAVDSGTAPPAAPPEEVATAAYLLRPDGWQQVVEAVSAEIGAAAERATDRHSADAVTRLTDQLAALRVTTKADQDRLRTELRAAKEESTALRAQLRTAQDAVRRTEDRVAAAERETAAVRATGETATRGAATEVRRARARIAELEAALDVARRQAKEARTNEDVRVRLLVDSIVSAAQGLREELALPPVTERPGDRLAVERGLVGSGDVHRTAAADEAGVFEQLLRVPGSHVIVDGYNVTKTGYGDLPLDTQRARLVTGLGHVTARTGAEVTCVFDGAERPAAVSAPAPRGVRVVFSPRGTTADSVIVDFVRAEPVGRTILVVTSDREVVDNVERSGATAVGSPTLLAMLDRG